MLDQAKQEKVKFAQDQIAFPRLYASLGRLGKAVPADEDVPSLLVQLNHAAAKANVNFHSVELKLALAEKVEQEAAAAAAAATAAARRRTDDAAATRRGRRPPPQSGRPRRRPRAAGAATRCSAGAAGH